MRFDDVGNRPIRQALGLDVAATANGAEDYAFGDPRGF